MCTIKTSISPFSESLYDNLLSRDVTTSKFQRESFYISLQVYGICGNSESRVESDFYFYL